jgi:hypothetical protein
LTSKAQPPRHRFRCDLDAAALARNLIIATRSIGDFERLGVQALNPFEWASI